MAPILGCFMFICNPVKAVNLQDATGTFAEGVAEEQVSGPKQEESAYRMGAQMKLFEQMPRFNGGGANDFSLWLNSRIQATSGVEGRVLVQFTVGADGEVCDVKVIKGLREDLDDAVVQAVSASPRWEPALNSSGEPTAVTFSVPVIFRQS
jgi:protein TonB